MELQGATIDVILNSAWCTNDDVSATLQVTNLSGNGIAPINRDDFHAFFIFGKLTQFLTNL